MYTNIGIGVTPNADSKLHANGKVLFDPPVASFGAPANGILGDNNGTRLVLWPGTSTDCPYALGIYWREYIWRVSVTYRLRAGYVPVTCRLRAGYEPVMSRLRAGHYKGGVYGHAVTAL